ncbi:MULTISPECIES: hypothetical protein [Sphingopyxis]|uniref:hypothetical protein n=1 Tax=Sphingopyxis TaxID=165697 RepID=UPI0015CBE7EA|nr:MULTISPECIES: hypothetical protein [Sphingopyxis]NYF33382.1 hypothetical protein [Sphingopyxis sp. JAI108]
MTGRRAARWLSLCPLLFSSLLIATCSSGETPTGVGEGAAGTATAGAAAPKAAAGANPGAEDRDGALRAAGYRQRGGTWMTSCEADMKPVPKDSWYGVENTEMRDLNGDGIAEAVISGGSSYCFGNTGLAFKLLAKSGTDWKVMTDSMGIPGFYPRKGIAWPDIEVGGPGADCFPFLRWNGREYVYGGRSLVGRICELAPAFAPKPKAAETGLPMATGLWARNRTACDALARGQGDPDFIFDGKVMTGPQDYYNVTPFKALGGGRYQTGGEDERQVIDMNDPKFIIVQQGNWWTGGYTWCSSAQRWKPWEYSEEGF